MVPGSQQGIQSHSIRGGRISVSDRGESRHAEARLPKKESSNSVAILLVASLFCFGCTDSQSNDETDLAQLTREERWSAIRHCDDPGEKVDLYLAAMEVHPPDTALASAVAVSGPEVVPSVRARIRTSDDASKIADLFLVLQAMETGSHYCVSCDTDLLAELQSVVQRMKPSAYKDVAEHILGELRRT